MDPRKRTGGVTTSIEDAVQELLSVTNAAVKKLTDTDAKPKRVPSPSDEATLSHESSQSQEEKISEYEGKGLLEVLCETHPSQNEGGDGLSGDEKEVTTGGAATGPGGKVVDVTNVLDEMPRSEISILDVGGEQPDTLSSISTPSQLVQEAAQSVKAPGINNRKLRTDGQNFTVGGLPGDSILSPISYLEDAPLVPGHPLEHEESLSIPEIQLNGHKNLTSSTKTDSLQGASSLRNSSGNSSTASEVLRQSTRAPKIPDYAKLKEKMGSNEPEKLNADDKTALKEVKQSGKPPGSVKPTRDIIIRKSNHVPQTTVNRNSGQNTLQNPSRHRVRLPKKKLKEVKSPHDRQSIKEGSPIRQRQQDLYAGNEFLPQPTLAQGVVMDDKENKDSEVDSDLKIIRGSKDLAKRKLMEAKGSRLTKRVIPAKIIEEKLPSRKTSQDDLTTFLTTAMASAAPMLQVKQDLESQVKRLTDKLDELEKQKRLEDANKHQERAKDLEVKLEELTTQRLHSLEQLQEQQAAWQSHLLRVIGNMHLSQSRLATAAKKAQLPAARHARLHDIPENPDVLQTPAPRAQAPYPIPSKVTGKRSSPGNAYLLKNILDQMDVSTPGASPAIQSQFKNLRDPLADVTPVREPAGITRPKGINMTSTPQADVDARTAVLRARKEAEEEAERRKIMERFPDSLSVYMTRNPDFHGNVTKILPESKIPVFEEGKKRDSSLERIRKELEELRTKRTILDENMAKVERDRDCNDITAKVNYEILAEHPDADPAKIEKLRVRKMVEEQIKALETLEKDSGFEDRFSHRAGGRKGTKPGRPGRLPTARPGARIDTGLTKKHPPPSKPKPTRKKAHGPTGRQVRSHSPSTPVCVDTEDHVTHVYGRADYHPRRTTVHDPFMHVNSPHKKPKFRKKEAVEVVKPYFVKSAKTQTSPAASTVGPSQYYFSPSTSPVRPPISVSPTPGQLIPMAIPLGAPRISDGVETVPVIIPREDPAYRTFIPQPERTIRIYDPNAGRSEKPNAVTIRVKGEDGPDLAVQKLDNIDIDTPDVTEVPGDQTFHPPLHDGLPGSTIPLKHDKDEPEDSDGSLHIELCGAAGSEAPIDYHGPSFPPVAPSDKFLSAGDIAEHIDKHELEQETMRWVEQEILARILSELHPPGTQRIRDSGPVEDKNETESPVDGEPVLLNPESLQLFIDAGLPIDEATVNRLVEEELTRILREMIKRPAQDQTTRPKTPIAQPRVVTQAPSYQIPTPLPTPEPSPASSVSEKPRPHLHTPSLTPESSIVESLPFREPSPASSREPEPLTPKASSPPKTPEEITLVETPAATPPHTPTPEPKYPGTPSLSHVSASPPVTPKQEYPDPWGGTEFPLPEEIHMGPKRPSAMTFAPPPDALDLVVRTVTPPPTTPPDRSLSEPDTTTTISSERGESSISEGQLLISHGEVRAKMKKGQLPGIIEEIFGDEDVQRSMAFQSTLRDANDIQDYEPYSDGEIRLSMRPSMISRVAGHGRASHRPHKREPFLGDDPAGIYTRPRHPLPSDDEDEELSVGEVKPQTIASRRNKFRKWREERSPKYSSGSNQKKSQTKPKEVYGSPSPDSPLSMDDLNRQVKSPGQSELATDRSSALSETDENLGGNVIVVAPATSSQPPRKSHQLQYSRKTRPLSPTVDTKPADPLASDDFKRIMASTDHSSVLKDSLEESMQKKVDLERFFDDGKDPAPTQPALKVSLTLPTVEPAVSMSSGPVTDGDDVSEISAGGF